MTRAIKRGGKVWINIFPDKPVTKKPAETRMGSGKGNPEFWVAVVRPVVCCSSCRIPTRRSPRPPCQGHPEAADQGSHHHSRGGLLMAKSNAELKELDLGALVDELRATSRRR
jgi:hypothetical protein